MGNRMEIVQHLMFMNPCIVIKLWK